MENFFEKYHPANKKNHKNLDWYYQNELILRTVNDQKIESVIVSWF